VKLWFERGAWVSTGSKKLISKISPESVRRIVVIRHAALGDMVLTRPFLVEARKFFPNAKIVLSIVSNYSYGVPSDLVDSIHVLHGTDQPGVGLGARLARARELGSADILFDLADTTRSRYLTWLSNAKVKIGFPYRWYLRNLLFDAAVFRSDFVFEAEVMLDTLKIIGANPKYPPQFNWPKISQRASGDFQVKRIVYFPFASVQSKCWPKEHFSELIGALAAELPDYCHVILAGIGKDEDPTYFSNMANTHQNVELQSASNLEFTIQFLAYSHLLVSNDTGVRNLAISVDTPTLGIFFSTVPHRYWPRGNGRHEAVFLSEGEVPPVDRVAAEARRLLRGTAEQGRQ
jgi:ADP-heptose:LPS heptosyltransferase